MSAENLEEKRSRKHEMNTSFILRLTWDSVAQNWRIVIKPLDGKRPRVFADMESVFLHIAALCTEIHQLNANSSSEEQEEKGQEPITPH